MVILSDHVGSSSPNQYDVFLSFRGSDTRHGFTDHLYHHLNVAGVITFRDEKKLERGESLKPQLENAIKQSSMSIIVFSQNYASSRWCLDELLMILEQKSIRNHKVLPIFYHVDVADVRHQRGEYGEAFNRHIEKGRVSIEKIIAWKEALTVAADLFGLTVNNKSEVKFVGKILNEVIKNLPKFKLLDVPKHLLGMHYRAKWIDSWFKDRSTNNTVLIIWGIGGIGKTTIAKHCFNEYFREFDSSCFLALNKPTWDQSEACSLQSQLLYILNKQRKKTTIFNCDEGIKMIERAIGKRKVLLVLDDVSDTKQLDALLGQQEFCAGSKIIITTRNEFLAKHFIVHPKVHKIECLNDIDSLKLFSWHAFRQYHLQKDYKQLSEKILLRCGGLPLALIVLGSSLLLDIVFWERQLQKWDEIMNPDIHKVMKISYDSLEDNTVKSLFLHVACFLVGEKEDFIVKILDGCGLHASIGIQSLIDRCLIKIDDKKIMMHRVIQDLGREIVRQESPDEPGQRSRLWYHEDSFDVLKYNKGTEAVKGLILDGQKINKFGSDESSFTAADSHPGSIIKFLGYVKNKKEEVFDRFFLPDERNLQIDAFAKMVNLELVKINNVHLTGSCNKFPEKLRWISWNEFPQEYVPIELPLQNLIAFDLHHSLLKQVWKGYKEVKSLKILNLSYSEHLYRTPDFRGLKQLERLILRGCSKLVVVCKTIGILQKLVLLDLRDCMSLKDLPGLPKSLVTIEFSGCNLGQFPREQQNLESFDWKRIVKFASPRIAMGPVILLTDLPHLLVRLYLGDCNLSDECFPKDFGGLSSLEGIDLCGNLITKLPDCVRNLSNSRLSWLNISDCPKLQSVISPPSSLKYMRLCRNKQLERTKIGQNLRELCLGVDEHTKYIEMEGYFKVVQARDVDRKVIKNLGLEPLSIDFTDVKVKYEYGIFSTCVKGGEVPSCFTIYSYDGEEESKDRNDEEQEVEVVEEEEWDEVPCLVSILYAITSSVGSKIQGLNVCFAIKLNLTKCQVVPVDLEFDVEVCNKTKDLAWLYKSRDGFHMESHKSRKVSIAEVLWVSTWKCVDVFEGGDEIEVSFHISGIPCSYEIKDCGIRMIYEEEDFKEDNETENTGLLWTDELNVSFASYRTPGITNLLQGQSRYGRDVIQDETNRRAGTLFILPTPTALQKLLLLLFFIF